LIVSEHLKTTDWNRAYDDGAELEVPARLGGFHGSFAPVIIREQRLLHASPYRPARLFVSDDLINVLARFIGCRRQA
jgi:hypothetical protein